jgi:hypothetical protein
MNFDSSFSNDNSWCLLFMMALISSSTLGLDDLLIKESSLLLGVFSFFFSDLEASAIGYSLNAATAPVVERGSSLAEFGDTRKGSGFLICLLNSSVSGSCRKPGCGTREPP